MRKSKLSYCWHAMAASYDSAVEVYRQMREWNLAGLLVMEAGEEASKHKDQRPDAIIIHRLYGPHGDASADEMAHYRQYYNGHPADDPTGVRGYMDYNHRYVRRPDVVLQIMNESGVRPANTEVAMEAARYAEMTGVPIAVNFDGLGGPDDSEVAEIARFILYAAEINRRIGYNLIYVMFHEYYAGHDPRFDGMKDGRYQNHDPLQHNGNDPTNMLQYNNWYIGRFARIMYIMEKQYGLPVEDFPQVIIGEHGPDDLDSRYKGWRPDPYDPAGPSLTEEEYGTHLIWMQNNVYDPVDTANPYYRYAQRVALLTIFSYNNSGGWHTFDVWQSHFNGHAYGETAWRLFDMLENFAMRKMGEDDVSVIPDIPPKETDVLVHATGAYTNVRTGPATTYEIAGEIFTDAVPAVFIGHTVDAAGHYWFNYNQLYDLKQDAYLDDVWIRSDVHNWEIEEVPVPEPPTENGYVTQEQFEQLSLTVIGLRTDVLDLKMRLTSVEEILHNTVFNSVTYEEVKELLQPVYNTFAVVSEAYAAFVPPSEAIPESTAEGQEGEYLDSIDHHVV